MLNLYILCNVLESWQSGKLPPELLRLVWTGQLSVTNFRRVPQGNWWWTLDQKEAYRFVFREYLKGQQGSRVLPAAAALGEKPLGTTWAFSENAPDSNCPTLSTQSSDHKSAECPRQPQLPQAGSWHVSQERPGSPPHIQSSRENLSS